MTRSLGSRKFNCSAATTSADNEKGGLECAQRTTKALDAYQGLGVVSKQQLLVLQGHCQHAVQELGDLLVLLLHSVDWPADRCIQHCRSLLLKQADMAGCELLTFSGLHGQQPPGLALLIQHVLAGWDI